VVPSSMMAGGTLKLATRTSGGGGGTEKKKTDWLTINLTMILQKEGGFLTALHGVLKLELKHPCMGVLMASTI